MYNAVGLLLLLGHSKITPGEAKNPCSELRSILSGERDGHGSYLRTVAGAII